MVLTSWCRQPQVRRAVAWLLLAIALSVLVAALAPAVRSALTHDVADAPLLPDVCVVAPPTPYNPASGLPLDAPRVIPVDARCPVCGMFPARSPDWAAQVIFSNGDAQFFDSPLSLFSYLQDVGRYTRGRDAGQIVARYVSDADSGRWIDARSAMYVHGSAARGPMRSGNLPAFANADAAQHFASARGGIVLRAADITPALLQGLAGASTHRH